MRTDSTEHAFTEPACRFAAAARGVVCAPSRVTLLPEPARMPVGAISVLVGPLAAGTGAGLTTAVAVAAAARDGHLPK